MSKDSLNCADIDALVQHMGRKAMPENVEPVVCKAFIRDLCLAHITYEYIVWIFERFIRCRNTEKDPVRK